MAGREHDPEHQPTTPSGRSLIYLPCPACKRAVRLSDENRVHRPPDTYECPSCTARFVLSDVDSD
jgi:hypothetical protein